NGIVTEMLVNRVAGDRLGKVEDQISGPLYDMTHKSQGDFLIVEKAVSKLFQGLDEDAKRLRQAELAQKGEAELIKSLEQNRPIHKDEGAHAVKQMTQLSKRLRDVLQAMADVGDLARIVRILVQIEAERREHHRLIRVYYEDLIKDVLGGL